MKAWRSLCLLLCCLTAACGYQWQGFGVPAVHSVLGDGSKTLRIAEVEQSTLYPWVAPYVRSRIRDEINLRKLAIMADSGEADYTLHVNLPYFLARSYISDDEDQTLLSTAATGMTVELRDGASGSTVWSSGEITYSERYEESSEEQAIQEVIDQVVYRIMDRMQQTF